MADYRTRILPFSPDRESEVSAHLDRQLITLHLEQPHRLDHQVIAITITSLLARVFPNVYLTASGSTSSHPLLPPGPATLGDRVAQARADGGIPTQGVGSPTLTICIGNHPSTKADLYVGASDWTSYVGGQPPELPDPTTTINVGALVAAARGAAIAFTQLLHPLLPLRPVPVASAWSALTYQDSTDRLAIPTDPPRIEAILVGAGSIGGSAIYAFRHTPELAGELHIVDPQSLEPPNVPKGILATDQAAAAGLGKAHIATEAMSHLRDLGCDSFEDDITAFHAKRSRETLLPLIVAAVDSLESREEIQDCLPIRVINAACNADEFTVSGHITDQGPCVCCLHMPDVMNSAWNRSRSISDATGIAKANVDRYLSNHRPLSADAVRTIEGHRGSEPGSLDHLVGISLDSIWNDHLRYAEFSLGDQGTEAIVAPFITALAGFLLAGEAIKAGNDEYRRFRLGPDGHHIQYQERPTVGPEHGQLTNPFRWPTNECLCRSTRRLRLFRERLQSR